MHRPHVGHQKLRVRVELDVLDDRLVDPQQGAPQGGALRAVLRSLVHVPQQLRTLDRNGVLTFSDALNDPRIRDKGPKT